MATTSTTSSAPPSTPSPSPSKSTSRFHLPSAINHPRSQVTQSNAHPYAIKTTSTALLSRSTSSSAQSVNAVHRYVPLSPSSSPNSSYYEDGDDDDREYGMQTKPRRHSKASRHRYSRSLTDVGPIPLPVPPGALQNAGRVHSQASSGVEYSAYSPSSSSPTRGVRERARSFVDDEEIGQTLRRGSMGPPRTPSSASGLNLATDFPEDPKIWTPEEVARYLGGVVRARAGSSASSGLGGDGDGTIKLGGGGGHNSNDALAGDLGAFVTDKQISGRGFMRITEADLEGYGIPHMWRATLLSASRGLRQKSLRERFFPSATLHHEPDDDSGTAAAGADADEAAYESANFDTAPLLHELKRRGTRTRNSTFSNEASDGGSSDASSCSSVGSNAGGRVRDMVDSFERSKNSSSVPGSPTKAHRHGFGLELEEEGSASASASSEGGTSPVKRGGHENHHHTHTRALPHRGSVNDLFGGSAAVVAAASNAQEKEARDGGVLQSAGVARRNVNGREPRLLPFPPAGPPHNLSQQQQHGHGLGFLTPLHTGTRYALPTSPDHQQQQLSNLHHQHQHDPKADYELGFRHAVVRHGPSPSNVVVSSSSAGSGVDNVPSRGGEPGKGAPPRRLLPYPPVRTEMTVHHPRPRRLVVGVLSSDDCDGDVESAGGAGAGVGGAATTTTTTSDTDVDVDVYETALEGPSGESGDGADSQHRGGGHNEPTIEELLGRDHDQPATSNTGSTPSPPSVTTNRVSGVEAWEMELGETVKRISGSASASALFGSESPSTGGGGGAKSMARRDSGAEIGRKAARNATAAGAAGGTLGTGRRDKTKAKDLKRGAGIMNLFVPPLSVDEPASSVPVGLSATSLEEVAPEASNDDVRDHGAQDSSAEKLDDEQRRLSWRRREEEVARREVDVSRREQAVEGLETEVRAREEKVVGRETALAHLERAVSERGVALDERESAVSRRELLVDQWEAGMVGRESELVTRESRLVLRQAELVRREADLVGRLEKVESEMEEDVKELERRREMQLQLERERAEEIKRAEKEGEKARKEKEKTPLKMLKSLWGMYVLPIVGEERTPGFLKNSSSSSSTSTAGSSSPPQPQPTCQDTPRQISPSVIRRDFFLGRFTGGGYLVLMSIGVCVAVLRVVLGRRAVGLGRR